MDPIEVAGAVAALAAGVAGLGWLLRSALRWARKVGHLIDDLLGEPPRPDTGQPGRPGAMARLKAIEDQMSPNSGGSLRDIVDDVAAKLDAHLAAHAQQNQSRRGRRR